MEKYGFVRVLKGVPLFELSYWALGSTENSKINCDRSMKDWSYMLCKCDTVTLNYEGEGFKV